MALYEVRRIDEVTVPGQFVSAFVLASGAAQARARVAHLSGVTKTNVTAVRMGTSPARPQLLSAYWVEGAEEYSA